ncbi:7TM diverse intracellular signaling domain-containing protein [Cochleicola gelatinilyticus]|nr:7TM diverse intracellular signaling domain-containing protein [Cochleicola gelatinilyticus]
MRLQILPLALCLLMIMLGASLNANAFVLKSSAASTVLKSKEIVSNRKAPAKNATASTKLNLSKKNQVTSLKTQTKPALNILENELVASENSFLLESNTASMALSSLDNQVSFRKGMYYGFAFMVILLNFVCFLLFEEKLYLYYSLTLLGFTAVFFFSDGIFVPSELLENNHLNNIIQSALLLLATLASTTFASKYLNLKDYSPKLMGLTHISLGITGLVLCFGWFLKNTSLITAANTILFAVLGVYFVAGILLFSKKNYPKFFVIAYSIPLLFAFDYFVLQNMGVSFLNTQSIHLKAAAIVEMLILTYSILYRMRAIKEEMQLRQTEMRIFLKRQEVVNSSTPAEMIKELYLENLIMQYDLDGFEIKLLQYISEGKDNHKIARKLKTTEKDIEELIVELYHKLEISEHIQDDYRMLDAQPDYIYN